MPKPTEKYLAKFQAPHISHEDMLEGGKISYIETERFTAKSLHSEKTRFDEFDDSAQALFTNVFADIRVMEKFARGTSKTKEEFEEIVKLHSTRWAHSYPFSGFIILDNETGETVGYEVIGNGEKNSSISEIAYLTSMAYHREGTKGLTGVGYECIGGIVLYYGDELYRAKAHVNAAFNAETKAFEDGEEFSQFTATARIDNPASYRILQNLGLKATHVTHKFGHDRYEFAKDLTLVESDISYELPTIGTLSEET